MKAERAVGSSLAFKIGLKENARAYLARVPTDITKKLSIDGVRFSKRLAGSFDFIHAFFITADKLDNAFPRLAKHLSARGALWISWPKSGKLETDLSLKSIIKIGYSHGLVESKTIGVDATWSAIKFTFPKKGKQYNNSYGKLPSQRS